MDSCDDYSPPQLSRASLKGSHFDNTTSVSRTSNVSNSVPHDGCCSGLTTSRHGGNQRYGFTVVEGHSQLQEAPHVALVLLDDAPNHR